MYKLTICDHYLHQNRQNNILLLSEHFENYYVKHSCTGWVGGIHYWVGGTRYRVGSRDYTGDLEASTVGLGWVGSKAELGADKRDEEDMAADMAGENTVVGTVG